MKAIAKAWNLSPLVSYSISASKSVNIQSLIGMLLLFSHRTSLASSPVPTNTNMLPLFYLSQFVPVYLLDLRCCSHVYLFLIAWMWLSLWYYQRLLQQNTVCLNYASTILSYHAYPCLYLLQFVFLFTSPEHLFKCYMFVVDIMKRQR